MGTITHAMGILFKEIANNPCDYQSYLLLAPAVGSGIICITGIVMVASAITMAKVIAGIFCIFLGSFGLYKSQPYYHGFVCLHYGALGYSEKNDEGRITFKKPGYPDIKL